MKENSRRGFIQNTGKATLAGALFAASGRERVSELNDLFVHHVFFWLKNPASREDLEKLVAGLKKLSAVKTIKQFHIGKPADTNRDVIDRSYAVSWLAMFDNKADQDSYQADPIHLKFVEECSSLWSKVIVYDSIAM